jgi:hypothetical protein
MRLELASAHALTDLPASGAKPGTPLDQKIEHIIIKRDDGIGPLILGFEQDALGTRSLEDLADRRVRVSDGVYARDDPPE